MMRARLDKQQEGQQQRIETILLATAAILSVPVLIEKETTQGLLEFVGVPAHRNLARTGGPSALYYDRLAARSTCGKLNKKS